MFQVQRVVGLALVVALGLAAVGLAGAEDPKPLNEAELLKLVELQQKVEAMLSRIEKRGVDPSVDAAAVERLRKSGAPLEVLSAIRKARTPKESVTINALDITDADRDQFTFRHMAFSPDGKLLAYGGGTGVVGQIATAWLIDAATGKVRHTCDIGSRTGTFGIYALAFSPDSKSLATCWGKRVRLWDVETGKAWRTLEDEDRILSSTFAPDGKTLAIGLEHGKVILWSTATWEKRATLTGHEKEVWGLSFAPDSTTLASGSHDGTVRLWDVATAKHLRTLKGREDKLYSVNGVAFAPDGKTLATANGDQTVKIFDANTGKLLANLEGHTSVVSYVAFSPDGRTLASAGWDATVTLWDVMTRKDRDTLRGHTHRIRGLAFSPDGKTLASATTHGILKLWSVDSPARARDKRQ
jgi:WD40 repeat protein